MRFLCNWSLFLLIFGSGLFLVSLSAAASDFSSTSALTWRDLALAAVGLIAAIAGAYAKGQDGRIKTIESAVSGLNLIAYRIEQTERKMEAAMQQMDSHYSRLPAHMRPDDGN